MFFIMFFMLLCALCVGGWLTSYWQSINFMYGMQYHNYFLGIECGSVWLSSYDLQGPGSRDWGWSTYPPRRENSRMLYNWSQYHFAGFAWLLYPSGIHGWTAFVPFWFPTSLSTLVLWFAWKKTKRSPAGFPVEASAKQ
jgi:hypothetical protein